MAKLTTFQKLRRLAEGLFGLVIVVIGLQVSSVGLSLSLLVFGWALLVALVWELSLFDETRHLWLRKSGNYILAALVLIVVVSIWWETRPAEGQRQD